MAQERKHSLRNEFITINVTESSNYSDKVKEIKSQVDKLCDDRLKKLEAKAVKGGPTDIVLYNAAVMQDKHYRSTIKRYFLDELDKIERMETV